MIVRPLEGRERWAIVDNPRPVGNRGFPIAVGPTFSNHSLSPGLVGWSIDPPVDPAAAENQVSLVDGHDLTRRDGRHGGVKNDPRAPFGKGLDGRGDGLMLGADLDKASGGAVGQGALPVEPGGFETRPVKRFPTADRHRLRDRLDLDNVPGLADGHPQTPPLADREPLDPRVAAEQRAILIDDRPG